MEVFFTSPWVPTEWIKAHGLEPRGIWLARDFACEPLPLAAGVCAFANAVVRLAERQAGSAVIFTTHCDQLRRGFDTVAEAAATRVFLFNLPVTWQTPVAERIYADELRRLGRFLVGLGGHAPVVAVLVEIIMQRSRARQRLLEAAPWCPARAYAEAVARFHLDGSVHLPPEDGDHRAAGMSSIPLALVGGPLPQSQMPLLEALEKAGGRVVLNATEAGERSLWADFSLIQDTIKLWAGHPERGGDSLSPQIQAHRTGDKLSPPRKAEFDAAVPVERLEDNALDLLVRGYLANYMDVFQRPNTRLYDWLRVRLTARQVRGIVLWHYVGCDLWRAEAQPMRAAFGLPVLLLDADEAAPNRNTGRLEAFLESLR
jgi:2-hydroxyglutaryl-CoA dehydratase, D-component